MKFNKKQRRTLRRHRRHRKPFEKRLYRHWKRALDLFELICLFAQDAGAEFDRRERDGGRALGDAKFEALSRLHARACLLAVEINTLLRSGFADGAYARWRSLHEFAVVAVLIREKEPSLAERYLLHEFTESLRAAEEYAEHQEALEFSPIPQSELEELRARVEELERTYGRQYRTQYGWAAELVEGRPTFKDLEAAAGLQKWRPFYRLASHGVHPNPKAIFWSIAAGRLDRGLLAGPSNAGLADPGHQALISLQSATAALLSHQPELTDVLNLKAMLYLVDQAGEEFIKAHRELEGYPLTGAPDG